MRREPERGEGEEEKERDPHLNPFNRVLADPSPKVTLSRCEGPYMESWLWRPSRPSSPSSV